MLINPESDNEDVLQTKSFNQIRDQVESQKSDEREKGVKRLQILLNAYRKRENLEKADFYLLQGIYDYDPEAADFKYLY